MSLLSNPSPTIPVLRITVFVIITTFVASPVVGQIVTLPLPSSEYCSGDSVFVSYTANGSFQNKNAFTLQLSNTTGSFSNFQNIGSLAGSNSGTIRGAIPTGTQTSSHYRFRVISGLPYMAGSDNGSDVSISAHPSAGFVVTAINKSKTGVKPKGEFQLVGDSFYFQNTTKGAVSYQWDFADGAVPRTSVDSQPGPIYYTTPGPKYVRLTATSVGGCSTTATARQEGFGVFSCSPEIPHQAIVVNSNILLDDGRIYWINPGISVTAGSYDTIFCEAGSSVQSGGSNVVYLKSGAQCATMFDVIVEGPDVSVTGDNVGSVPHTSYMECQSLDFDYHNAPPNPTLLSSTVRSQKQMEPTLHPNPANERLRIDAPRSVIAVSVRNLMGDVVLERTELNQQSLDLDVSRLPSGTYYVTIRSEAGTRNSRVLVLHE